MASCSAVLLLLSLLAGAAVHGGCEVSALAAEVAASCAPGTDATACCKPVLASVELGGGHCLCRLASEMPILHAGLNGCALVALYTSCRGGSSSLAACDGVPPSGPVVPALRLVNDRTGGTPESSSVPLSPPPVVDVVQARSDDRKLFLSLAVSQVVGLALTLILATIEVCRCVNGRKQG